MRFAGLAIVLLIGAACGDDGAGDAADATPAIDGSAAAIDASATADSAPATDGAPIADARPTDTSTYTAVAMPGGLDRVRITRVNSADQTCMTMTLVSPMMFDDFDIDIPDLWRIESVARWDQATCTGDMDELSDGGTGAITFGGYDGLGLYPCLLSIDVVLDFAASPDSAWSVQDVPVDGVTCT